MGYPIQGSEEIPEWLAEIVYQGYINRYGSEQSYERIRERGGFGQVEVIWLLNCLNIKTIEDAEQALKV